MQIKDERTRLAIEGRSSSNIEDRDIIKYLLANVDLLQEENRKSQVVNIRTQEMVGDLLAMLKGGSVTPSSQMSLCSTVPLPE